MDRPGLQKSRDLWDNEAATFDAEADHGLRDPSVYEAWERLLSVRLPSGPADIVDLGCGTGSLSVLLARLGHRVTGVDLSPAMIGQAEAKAAKAGQQIDFSVMDAAHPQLPDRLCDVVLCRHILWALPEPPEVLLRWQKLLAPGGRFVLIEGHWHTGGGLHSEQVVEALPESMVNVQVINLSDQPELWGGPVSDQRYVVTAELSPAAS